MRKLHTPRWMWWSAAGLIAAWLLWMTLRPNANVAADLLPLTDTANAQGISTRVLIDLAGNIVVFVPLGATLAMAWDNKSARRRWLTATLAGAGLSLTIELLQTAAPSRVAALDDVVLNTLGAAAGAAAALLVAQRATKANGLCK